MIRKRLHCRTSSKASVDILGARFAACYQSVTVRVCCTVPKHHNSIRFIRFPCGFDASSAPAAHAPSSALCALQSLVNSNEDVAANQEPQVNSSTLQTVRYMTLRKITSAGTG